MNLTKITNFISHNYQSRINIFFGTFDAKVIAGNLIVNQKCISTIKKYANKNSSNNYVIRHTIYKYLNKIQIMDNDKGDVKTLEVYELDKYIDDTTCCVVMRETVVDNTEFPNINSYNDEYDCEMHYYELTNHDIVITKYNNRYEVMIEFRPLKNVKDTSDVIDSIIFIQNTFNPTKN